MQPTKSEMLEFLATQTCGEPLDEFDAEEAIYWFAYDYHGGAASELYSILSASPFNPGPVANGPEKGSMGAMLYECLEDEFAGAC